MLYFINVSVLSNSDPVCFSDRFGSLILPPINNFPSPFASYTSPTSFFISFYISISLTTQQSPGMDLKRMEVTGG
ncbi:hypothetical protein RIF29_41857 [Crotalaria pallida]|uniref:Uncharacterized protein n=1 Tax=Crotalaria pallida TaxID=3830 RepID=A0AAN9E8U0_CROPI